MNAPIQGTGDADELRQIRLRKSLIANGYRGFTGMPIGAGVTANIPPEMQAGWAGYWAAYDPSRNGKPAELSTGGTLTRMSPTEAVYWRSGVTPFTVSPGDNLNVIANIDPAIAEAWSKDYEDFKVIPL